MSKPLRELNGRWLKVFVKLTNENVQTDAGNSALSVNQGLSFA